MPQHAALPHYVVLLRLLNGERPDVEDVTLAAHQARCMKAVVEDVAARSHEGATPTHLDLGRRLGEDAYRPVGRAFFSRRSHGSLISLFDIAAASCFIRWTWPTACMEHANRTGMSVTSRAESPVRTSLFTSLKTSTPCLTIFTASSWSVMGHP